MADANSIQGPTERQKEIAAFYQAGGSQDETCKHFHCGHKTFRKALDACGVPARRATWPINSNGRMKSPELREKLVADFLVCHSIRQVARVNKCHVKVVRDELRRRGIDPMLVRHAPILPFPENIDRRRFGDWLSGFVDGEGCFGLYWHTHNLGHKVPRGTFAIGLRNDDREALQLIQSYFSAGWLRTDFPNNSDGSVNRNPRCTYKIDSTDDLVQKVIAHFDNHPLRAKKLKDYMIWREAVLLCHQVSLRSRFGRSSKCRIWQPDELSHFGSLYTALKRQRLYEAPVQPLVLAQGEPSLFDLL